MDLMWTGIWFGSWKFSLFFNIFRNHGLNRFIISFQIKPNATWWSDAHSTSRRVNNICTLVDACCTQRGQSEQNLIQIALKANLISEHAAWKTWWGKCMRQKVALTSVGLRIEPFVKNFRSVAVALNRAVRIFQSSATNWERASLAMTHPIDGGQVEDPFCVE